MPKNTIVAVLGSGNMGTAIANVVAHNGFRVNLWNYEKDPEPLRQIEESGENKKYLPGLKLSKNIYPIADMATALKGASVVFFVVPSRFVGNIVKLAAPHLEKKSVCVDVTKGIDEKSLGIIPQIIEDGLPAFLHRRVATISGPAIARDMARNSFTAMNIASKDKKISLAVKKVMENENLKLLYTPDVIGVEVTGSFKNVYAIAMGLCDGLGIAMNTKAALLVIALNEIGMLVKKMGGKMETLYGLAGLGDLVGTSLCATSRNRRFGEYLITLGDAVGAVAAVGQTVEGVRASKVLYDLSKKYKIKLPFAKMVYDVVTEKKEGKKALIDFLKKIK